MAAGSSRACCSSRRSRSSGIRSVNERGPRDAVPRGRSRSKPVVKSAQNRTKHRNPTQAILPARAHSYWLGYAQSVRATTIPRVASGLRSRSRTMNTKYLLAASLLAVAMSTTAEARTLEHGALPQAYASEEGREVAAPRWSAACMTDHGPTECDEPMWVYGSPRALSRYRSAF